MSCIATTPPGCESQRGRHWLALPIRILLQHHNTNLLMVPIKHEGYRQGASFVRCLHPSVRSNASITLERGRQMSQQTPSQQAEQVHPVDERLPHRAISLMRVAGVQPWQVG